MPLITSVFIVKNTPLYFLTLFFICSPLSHPQTGKTSPLMMMDVRNSAHDHHFPLSGKSSGDALISRQENAQREEERGRALSDRPVSRESLAGNDQTPTTTESSSIQDLKDQQVEFITSKISFLKNLDPDETDLIALLETYLDKYEKEVFDLRTFNEWKADLLTQQQQNLRLEEQRDPNSNGVELQHSILTVVCCEQEIMNALLSDPPDLERARAYYHIRAISLESKAVLEKAHTYFDKENEYTRAIEQYDIKHSEYKKAREAYFDKIEGDQHFHQGMRCSWNEAQAIKKFESLLIKARSKTADFINYKENFTRLYGQLEEAEHLKNNYLKMGNIMRRSSFYGFQRATTLEHLINQDLGKQEQFYYDRYATILKFLAQDHLLLAEAIPQGEQALIDTLTARISLAKEAKLVSEHQLSIFSNLSNQNRDQDSIAFSQAALSLFKEASDHFLSAYEALKNHSSQDVLKELQTRGRVLINLANIFQIAPIPPAERELYDPDCLKTIEKARHHAELVIQKAATDPERPYHEKIGSLLYERISLMNPLIEINELKTEFPQHSIAFSFLEEAASLAQKSSDSFLQLSELPFEELYSTTTQNLINIALEIKDRAFLLLSQTKKLLSPPTAVY